MRNKSYLLDTVQNTYYRKTYERNETRYLINDTNNEEQLYNIYKFMKKNICYIYFKIMKYTQLFQN